MLSLSLVACSESCNAGAESPGLNRCYGLDATSCCRVYNNSMCDTECDDIIDLTTFDCCELSYASYHCLSPTQYSNNYMYKYLCSKCMS